MLGLLIRVCWIRLARSGFLIEACLFGVCWKVCWVMFVGSGLLGKICRVGVYLVWFAKEVQLNLSNFEYLHDSLSELRM